MEVLEWRASASSVLSQISTLVSPFPGLEGCPWALLPKQEKPLLSHVVGKLRTVSAERVSDFSVTDQIGWIFWEIRDLFKLCVVWRPAWELGICIYLVLECIPLQNKIFIKKSDRNIMGTHSGVLWCNSNVERWDTWMLLYFYAQILQIWKRISNLCMYDFFH